jgi:hypothetical protein
MKELTDTKTLGAMRSIAWGVIALAAAACSSQLPTDERPNILLNVEVDPGETTNLATSELARFAELLALWKSERLRLGIVLPSDVENQ